MEKYVVDALMQEIQEAEELKLMVRRFCHLAQVVLNAGSRITLPFGVPPTLEIAKEAVTELTYLLQTAKKATSK